MTTVLHTTGRPNPEVCSIRIVDDRKNELAQGQTGEIAARGPITPMQYVNNPELDALYRDAEGWVYTGDLGFIDEQGNLVLTGRKRKSSFVVVSTSARRRLKILPHPIPLSSAQPASR